MKAVYVTYYINLLRNVSTDNDIFVSLNSHVAPNSDLVYQHQIMAHPQFTHTTHERRVAIRDKFQGRDGLWFLNACMGYRFHEDGCRS